MKKFWIIILILLITAEGAFFFRENILNFYSKFLLRLPKIEKNFNNLTIEGIKKQILEPPPLFGREEDINGFLTNKGVIAITNNERVKNGLPPLAENPRLNESSLIKVEDMLKNQYFTHNSPSGITLVDLTKTAGYNFIIIGENLALGNFKDDEALVQAWMDSQGHRANILNSKYKEIGAAVAKGVFEGKTIWLAVQHFGTPISLCQEPNQNIKSAIELNQMQIQELQRNLNLLAGEIKNTKFASQKEYKQKIEEYNNLVSQYNNLASLTKNIVNQYNFQTQEFNRCLSAIQ